MATQRYIVQYYTTIRKQRFCSLNMVSEVYQGKLYVSTFLVTDPLDHRNSLRAQRRCIDMNISVHASCSIKVVVCVVGSLATIIKGSYYIIKL